MFPTNYCCRFKQAYYSQYIFKLSTKTLKLPHEVKFKAFEVPVTCH